MKKNPLKIVEVPIADLKENPRNPRVWSEDAIKNLQASIQAHGIVDPILLSGVPERINKVISGHFRLHVLRGLKYKTVPAIYLYITNEEVEDALGLRLNAVGGDWDLEMLKGFDPILLLDVGFSVDDLTNVWDQQLAAEDDEFNVAKAVEEIKEPVTKLGDRIRLGNHVLICGDSTDPKVIARLMGDAKADMLYCDPVYNIGLDYSGGIGGKKSYGGQVNDNRSDAAYRQFLKDMLLAVTPHMKSDHHAFFYCDPNKIGLVQGLFVERGYDLKRVCLWIKNNQNCTPKVAFNRCYEPAIYAIKGKPYLSSVHNLNEVLNREVDAGNRTLDDIADLLDLWLVKRLPTTEYEHPTAKPVTLHDRPLRRCTKPGDVVVDLSGGGGSTLIACDQLKRRAFLCELEPVFCDVIVRRYEQLTNNHAIYNS